MVWRLLTTMLVVALPGPAPPIRTNTSWTVVGSAEWSREAPGGPTSSRVAELTGPASIRNPARRTPSTSANFRAVTPLSGTIVA
jgi:hypothetical protein